MRMLRDKRGLEFAAVMVLVVLIAQLYMFIQLYTIADERLPVAIGEYQVAVLNAFNTGENYLLYVDQAARLSALRSLNTLAKNGGSLDAPCGDINGTTAWVGEGKDCLALGLINPQAAFETVFNNNIGGYLGAYLGVQIPLDNYELFVQKDKITGTATKSAIVNIQPPPGVIEVTAAFGWITVASIPITRGITGEYSFRPSFTINLASYLHLYDELKQATKDTYACILEGTKTRDECLDILKAKASVDRIDKKYVKVTVKNPVKAPVAMEDIEFALFLPEPKPVPAATPKAATE